MRYDAGVIGAGADGLVAATVLARAGLKVVLIERNAHSGGRLVTREFHPGFRASPFTDTVAEIHPEIFHSFDLARRGVLYLPESSSTAMWFERHHMLRGAKDDSALAHILHAARLNRTAIAERCAAEVSFKPSRSIFARKVKPASWPAADWAGRSLASLAETASADEAEHLVALALEGRTALASAESGALELLAAGPRGRIAGGLGKLGAALVEAAKEAGVEFLNGLEVTDIRQARRRVAGVTLADGAEITLGMLVSTLDLKRTFLSLFSWSALPKDLVARAGQWRMNGGRARLLLALDQAAHLTEPALLRGPVHLAPDVAARARANAAWRASLMPEAPPATLRFISAADPSLAPSGAATVTLTLSAVPFTLFDGGWTHEKREMLRARAFALLDAVMPGLSARVVGSELIVPSDIEEALGASEGDLDGGEIAPDQMFGFRPWLDVKGGAGARTPVEGLYLAGRSAGAGLLGTGLSGLLAARTLLADRSRR